VVRTSPRLIARHSAAPTARRRVSRRGGGRPHPAISLRIRNIAHLRAEVLFLMGNWDHAAPEGRALVLLCKFFF